MTDRHLTGPVEQFRGVIGRELADGDRYIFEFDDVGERSVHMVGYGVRTCEPCHRGGGGTMSIAIAHDQIMTKGGAERVAFEMARQFNAPIYAGAIDDDIVPDDVEAEQIFDGRVGKRMMRSHYLLQDVYQMQGWQHVDELYDHDVIIENKTNPWWFVPQDDQTVVRYCHSPPRALYDQFHRQGGHWLTRVLKTPMRTLFRQTIPYADAWACNSELVQQRLVSYLGVRDTSVVYPPVDVGDYGQHRTERDGNFFLTVSRLRGHKRIDEIIEAFNQLDKHDDGYRLVVCGEGADRDRLEEMAGDHVEFRGYVAEEEKRRLMAEAKAFVMAAENEDFGLTPVESFASGTPVIGVKDGYTQHQIADGKNGMLYSRQGGHLRERIRHFERVGVEWDAARLEEFAERFATDRFRNEMAAVVERARAQSEVEPRWADAAGRVERAEPTLTDGGEF